MFARVCTRPGPSLVQCRSLNVDSGVSADANLNLIQYRDGDVFSGVFVVVLNKDRTEHGSRRDRNVGSGVFAGALHKGTSSLVQCSECNAGSGLLPGGTDQGQDTP